MRTGLFTLGRLLGTPGALAAVEAAGGDLVQLLARHVSGDWGDLELCDKRLNDQDVHRGGRLLSAYTLKNGTRVWVLTEADRSATTVLLPEEY